MTFLFTQINFQLLELKYLIMEEAAKIFCAFICGGRVSVRTERSFTIEQFMGRKVAK